MGGDWIVGRADELTLLDGLVKQVAAGVGGVVLVEGEQGVGKTALLRAGLAGAAAAGCRVAWGAADELGQRFPLRLMAECLSAEGGLAEPGRAGHGEGQLVLAGDPVVAEVERLLELVDRLCAASPVVLVAEDLQWAGEASVLVWDRLSRVVQQLPLLVAGSLRPPPARKDLEGVRQDLVARGGSVVSLGPLPAAEVADLVGRVVGGRPGQRLARLVGRAGGNPLYARELADALVRAGRVRVAEGVAEVAGEVAEVTVPTSLAGVIEARLGSLGEDAVGVLRWAAVLGQEFSVTDLGVVTGRDASELTGVVAEVVAAGVVAEAGLRLAFRHALIRQVLYEGMPGSLAALHLQAARALAAAGAAAERVAAQLVAAPEIEDGWAWDWLAHTAPALIYRAPQVTADLLHIALAHVAWDDPAREALETALLQVAFLLAHHEEVERAGREVLARTQSADRAAQVAWLVAYTLLLTSRPAEGAAMVEQALAYPGLAEPHAARLRALHALILAILGELDNAARVADEALARADVVGDRFAAGYALLALSSVCFLRADEAGRLDHIDRALTVIGDDPQTTTLRVVLLSNRLAALMKLGSHAEALTTAQQALDLVERTGTPQLGAIRGSLASVYFDAGRWDDALAELEPATGQPSPDHHRLIVHGMIALIAVHRDDPDTAGDHLAVLADIPMRDAGARGNAYSALLSQALAAEREGRIAQAVAVLAQCLAPAFAEDMPSRYELLPQLVRLALAAGDTVTAAAAVAATAGDPDPVRAAAASHCRGLLQADPAPVLAATDGYQSAGMSVNRAMALEDAAVLLAGRGDKKAARAVFDEVISFYEGLGAEWDIRRAGARLRPQGIRGRRRARPATGWDALTPTETKIAYLIARGQSNPDIAAELWLSRNTVQTHVSHILAKLDARSRIEIVNEALQHPPARGHAPAG